MKFNLVFMFSLIVGLFIVSCSPEDIQNSSNSAEIVSSIDNSEDTFIVIHEDSSVAIAEGSTNEADGVADDEIRSQEPEDE